MWVSPLLHQIVQLFRTAVKEENRELARLKDYGVQKTWAIIVNRLINSGGHYYDKAMI